MKRSFLLLCAVLLVLGCALPLAAYRLTRQALDAHAAASPSMASSAPEPPAASPAPFAQDASVFLLLDEGSGQRLELHLMEYLVGAVAAEMPISWPDEALKAQAVAAHSYALFCRDQASDPEAPWRTVDPARRLGCLTDPVLRAYWGTAYEANLARLTALVEQVAHQVLLYQGAPACTSYFALSNGSTESSAAVWGTALPYLVPVDSSTDCAVDQYTCSITLSAQQVAQQLTPLGLSADLAAPEQWFGTAQLTDAGYVASLPVCGQTVSGTALRQALGLRSACFTIQYQNGAFCFTTRGYGHGVGLSQWGAKALAQQGQSYQEILAHYYPGTTLAGQ